MFVLRINLEWRLHSSSTLDYMNIPSYGSAYLISAATKCSPLHGDMTDYVTLQMKVIVFVVVVVVSAWVWKARSSSGLSRRTLVCAMCRVSLLVYSMRILTIVVVYCRFFLSFLRNHHFHRANLSSDFRGFITMANHKVHSWHNPLEYIEMQNGKIHTTHVIFSPEMWVLRVCCVPCLESINEMWAL